ncbi:endonuclease [Apocheima cinerarium nucleopolyhedrovirus]|uniref:endonuclease n=1 Tax=Apocheima cinerarium nucleopolyhedrovirus TaxID=307461 RepID=UPI0001D920A1|nr:endonuclease [Apocheima cinerarium nucleopolyhedrovirus]ADB84435.1 endonuclease [Apocheima cinerarium nucleopolyhedrovirus]
MFDNRLYSIYIIQTDKNQYYTGITSNVKKRFQQHVNGNGAKFLKCKNKIELVFQTPYTMCLSCSLKVEKKIKKRTKAFKIKLIKGCVDITKLVPPICRKRLCK